MLAAPRPILGKIYGSWLHQGQYQAQSLDLDCLRTNISQSIWTLTAPQPISYKVYGPWLHQCQYHTKCMDTCHTVANIIQSVWTLFAPRPISYKVYGFRLHHGQYQAQYLNPPGCTKANIKQSLSIPATNIKLILCHHHTCQELHTQFCLSFTKTPQITQTGYAILCLSFSDSLTMMSLVMVAL